MRGIRFDKERLVEMMRREGIGDTELERRTGVTRTMIYYLKTGQRKTASAEVIKAIADALGTTVAYLLGEDGPPPPRPLPEVVKRLAGIAVNLSGVRQEELLRIAAMLERLEAEEAGAPLPPAIDEIIRLVERIQPVDGAALIEALQSLLAGDRRRLDDLGEDGPQEPGEGE